MARTIGGLAHAGFFAVAVAAAVSLVDASRAGRAVAVVMIGNALALVSGVPLGTVLGNALGWRWAFVVLAAAMGALAVAVVRVLPPQRPGHQDSRTIPRTPVLTGIRRPAVLVMATTNIGIAGGALVGSWLLGVVGLPELGWVGAGLVAVSLLIYADRLRRVRSRWAGGRP